MRTLERQLEPNSNQQRTFAPKSGGWGGTPRLLKRCGTRPYRCATSVTRTGPSSPEGNSGESALYGSKSVNAYFFSA